MSDKKDFINYFRKASAHLDHEKPQSKNNPETAPTSEELAEKSKDDTANPQIEFVTQRINEYRKLYAGMSPDVLRNLIELKDITRQTKQSSPDDSFENINKRLGDEESSETLRQERWPHKVHCVTCGSKNIIRLPVEQQKSPLNYKYCCLDCERSFNDDTNTEIERGTPPLHSWMFCWYLLGCTDSMQYIANKLGLDLATVEMMVRHMRRLFKADQPLNHFMTYDEWSFRHAKSYQEKIRESLKRERLGIESVEAEPDTGERRRRKARTQPLNPKPRNRSG